MRATSVLLCSLLLLAVGCEREAPAPDPVPEPAEPADAAIVVGTDPHSYAEYERVRHTHLTLNLTADFTNHTLTGQAILDLERTDPRHARLVLDTRDLDIRDVTGAGAGGGFEPLSWRLADTHEYLGTPLVIALAPNTRQVRIDYATSPQAFGLQWLDGNQTTTGKPFLFSQSQPHYARTWVPLQDTPAVRYTFDAEIAVPTDLLALMGADGNAFERNQTGIYRFNMPEPIPAYLMAIAVGDLAFVETGPRSGVYAEPDLIDDAAWEFAQLEDMIDIGEDLYGPYQWGRYDLLVLPPSFPFGGMENPRLSYVTPTIIAGDRSLLALVAHELAHSWSGNLVTNAAWRDLWLNEGFTVYFEARIMEALYGREIRDMLALLGYQGLMETLDTADPADRQLVRDLSQRDPEQAFMRVPYDMGRLFLDFLEDRFGREAFDRFLRQYFQDFAFQSVTTEEFRDYLSENLLEAHPGRASLEEVDAWLYEPGLPETAVIAESDAFEQVDEWRERWLDDAVALDELPAGEWSVHEWRHFLLGLEDRLDTARMAALDEAFGLNRSRNYEILYLWLRRAIETRYEPALPRLERFLLEVGRNKFTRPLYQALARSEWGRDWAIDVYRRASPAYHPLTRQAAETALELERP